MLKTVLLRLALCLFVGTLNLSPAQAQGPKRAPAGKSTDVLPTETQIVDSIAPVWIAPTHLSSEKDIYDRDLWIQRMNNFVNRLARETPHGKPAAQWRTLVLFYPNTDTDYEAPDGQKKHYTGSLSAEQILRVQQTLQHFPEIIRRLTGGFCDMRMDLKTIQRGVQFGGIEERGDKTKTRNGFQHPVYPDNCQSEKRLYDDPNPYDNIIVLYNPGTIQQDLGGAGGAGGGRTFQYVQYGINGNWNPDNADESCAGFVHEWIHGLDRYFMGHGYKGRSLHHLYYMPDGSNQQTSYNWNWHAEVLQGRMMELTETRYGYSRAAWLSGSITHPLKGPLPVQLLTPLPGVTMPSGVPMRFEWNPAWAPSGATGYRFRLYSADKLAAPILSRDTTHPNLLLPTESLPVGNYVWTVQTFNADGKLSPVGETFALTVKKPTEVPPVELSRFTVNGPPVEVVGDYPFVPVRVSASSPCGLRTVYAKITYPSGRVQRLPLRKHSPNENEPTWYAKLALLPNETRDGAASCAVSFTAIDMAGRTVSVPAKKILFKPATPAPPGQLPPPHPPIAARLLNPLSLEEGQATPNLKGVKFPVIPGYGGPYPVYVLIDSEHYDEDCFIEVTAPDGTVDRMGLEKWIKFNGMLYGQYLFPPNDTGKEREWKIAFGVLHKGMQDAFTSQEVVTQPADTDNPPH